MSSEARLADTSSRPSVWSTRLQQFPWWLVAILAAIAVMIFRFVTDPAYGNAFAVIRTGLSVTIYTTIAAFFFALLLGLLAGLGRVSRNVVLRNIATTYIEFIRGVPILRSYLHDRVRRGSGGSVCC